ncbi:MAG: exopolysaccharide biosynthesis polyprenyl glycosylphosphotransferase [Elusimicrobiales bacterium]|nr:exopolysaccharide biosynthesis polyprenyl glycosylphosphotransferase [Elusimicrobiales bacterium]
MLIYRWRSFLLFLGDIPLFYAALALALMTRRFSLIPLEFYLEHVKVFTIFLPAWVGVFYAVGFYDVRRINRLVNLINSSLIAFAANLAAASALFYAFYLQIGLTPKTHLFLTFLYLHVFATVWRRVWTRAVLSKLLVQKVAFLGTNPLVEEIKKDLPVTPHLGFCVVPLPDLKDARGQEAGYWRPTGRCCVDLASKVDVLVLDADQAEGNPGVAGLLLSTAVMEEIPIITHLDFYEDLYGKIPPESAAKPSWLLSNVLHQGNRFYSVFKRFLDILFSAIGLILTLPLTLAVFAAVKLGDGLHAPVFFVQKRVGHLGRRFVIWKFRTMVQGASKAGPLYKAQGGDSRITGLGRFLRSTRLDEIPQLWNVFKGDMSLVGPRPEWTREVRILERSVPHYHLRHLIKPGVTGWAQINYHATSSSAESVQKLHYDLYYVKNMSLALDLGIILRTFRRVFQKDAAMARRSSV